MAVVGRVLSMPNQPMMGTPLGQPLYGKPLAPAQPLQPFQKADYGYGVPCQGQQYGRPLGMPIQPRPCRIIPQDDDEEDNNIEVVSQGTTGYLTKTTSQNSAAFSDDQGYNNAFAYMSSHHSYSGQYGYNQYQQYSGYQGYNANAAAYYPQGSGGEGSHGSSYGTLGHTMSTSSLDGQRCEQGSLNSSVQDNAGSVRSNRSSSDEVPHESSVHEDEDIFEDESPTPSPRGRSAAREKCTRSRSLGSCEKARPARTARAMSLEPQRSSDRCA
eukprot:TRINITY_DN15934_c0_g1_i1.p3 TRINITY_DN15934_c0_g1~~TRINITY_DN15934_c0_g1_i1.p3  ORF type:complete len:271 (+),score=95.84 TRINITY_DN15934_c0_g1_i1:136-948(+)